MKNKFIYLTVIIILILGFFGFLGYEYLKNQSPVKVQKNPQDSLPIQIDSSGIEINGQSQNPGLTVCLDKCGDGICQTSDPDCGKEGSNLNCICPETKQECFADCK